MTHYWRTATLGDLTQFINGLWKGEDPPFVRAGVIRNTNFTKEGALDDTDIAYLEVEAKKYQKRRLQFGDLVLEKSGGGPKQPVGRVVLFDKTEGEFSFSNFTAAIRILDPTELDSKFLHKFLHWVYISGRTEAMQSHSTGIRNLNGDAYKAIKVTYPLLEEQRRIVAILDNAFEGIATAKANAEKALLNGRKLFESALAQVFSADWSRVRIEDACQSVMDCVNKTAPTVSEATPYKMIRTTNVRNGVVSLAAVNYVSEDVYKAWTRRQVPLRGDVILTREAPMGEVGILDSDELVFLGQRLVSYRAEPTKLDARFLLYALQSEPLQRQIHAKASGSTVQHMRVPDSKNLQLPLPGLSQQREAVAKLDAMREETTHLGAIYARKIAALDELKKSLLHQAFTGQLTSAQTTSVTAVLALPTTSPEFSANVIALAYERHKRQQRERTFGHVKEQKLLHLVEAIAKVDLGRQPMKDAAGPNDFQHMRKAEEWAKQNGFFEMVQRGGGYDFKKLPAFDQLLAKAPQVLGASIDRIESVIDLLIPMDTKDAEVLATVHAAWNNLLIDGAEVTDEAIVWEARDGWHADKLAIPESKFRQAIALIRSKGLVPDGSGKYVGGQTSLI
ncbi:restriction endonuclease subunit S [Hydrogenophaga sp.]|uniref:restriction endonuclease subunit S n=1 Tax=Hydrogenophaga sp. TaxID=1904254 RepID=UPI003F7020CB